MKNLLLIVALITSSAVFANTIKGTNGNVEIKIEQVDAFNKQGNLEAAWNVHGVAGYRYAPNFDEYTGRIIINKDFTHGPMTIFVNGKSMGGITNPTEDMTVLVAFNKEKKDNKTFCMNRKNKKAMSQWGRESAIDEDVCLNLAVRRENIIVIKDDEKLVDVVVIENVDSRTEY